jgi:signal transduction histidine kinase
MGISMSAYPASIRSSDEDSALQYAVVDEIIKSPFRQAGAPVVEDSPSSSHSVDAPQLKNEVLAMVAHELRGTLTPLRFGTRIIRTALADRPDMLRGLDMIDRQTSEIERLSEDLVDATRVGQGGLRLDKLNVDVATILADSYEMLRRRLPRGGRSSPCRSRRGRCALKATLSVSRRL